MEVLLLQVGTHEALGATTAHDVSDYRAPSPLAVANLGTAFLNVARARADHPAVAANRDVFSYDWIRRAANCVGGCLRARLRHVLGARVALQLSNSPEYLAAFYGALLADCVVVPLPISLEEQRRRKILELSQPGVLITRLSDLSSQELRPETMTLDLPKSKNEKISFSHPRRQERDLAM